MLMVPLSTLITEGSHKTSLEEESTANLSSTSSSTPEQLGWGNQTTFSGSSTDDATQVLALENHSVIITRKGSTTLSNGTTSSTNGSSTVLVLIYDQNNSLIKHYHFGGSSSSTSNSEVYGIAKNPSGGFAISGCYWGGAAYIGNHRFSSYGSNGACFQGFLVSFDSNFEVDFAKEMNADGSGIANSNTWANLAIDDSGNIYISGNYRSCNSNSCLYFFDTDNSGNVKKTPAVSAYCQSKAYIYVAKINNNGAWQWVKVAGGSTTGSQVFSITHTNNSVYIAGKFSACTHGISGSNTYSSTANFGTYSFTVSNGCVTSGSGYSCGGFDRVFIGKMSSTGSWTGLVNTSGERSTTTGVAVNPPEDLRLISQNSTIYLAGKYNSQSWGLKFGDFVIPSTGKNIFVVMFHENLTSGNSITVGSSTDQVSCPVLHTERRIMGIWEI